MDRSFAGSGEFKEFKLWIGVLLVYNREVARYDFFRLLCCAFFSVFVVKSFVKSETRLICSIDQFEVM